LEELGGEAKITWTIIAKKFGVEKQKKEPPGGEGGNNPIKH